MTLYIELINKLLIAKSEWKGLSVETSWEQGRSAGFNEAFTIVQNHMPASAIVKNTEQPVGISLAQCSEALYLIEPESEGMARYSRGKCVTGNKPFHKLSEGTKANLLLKTKTVLDSAINQGAEIKYVI